MSASLSVIARRLSFIRETDGPNAGSWVNWLQRHGGDGVEGDSWCADFESVIEDIAYKGKAPLPRTGSCQTKLEYAMKKGWVVAEPQVDDVFFYVNDAGHAHHIGIVTAPYPKLAGIAGNTSADGASSNGDGVWEHELNVSRAHIVFVRLPQ
jgi:hypothetical protein